MKTEDINISGNRQNYYYGIDSFSIKNIFFSLSTALVFVRNKIPCINNKLKTKKDRLLEYYNVYF